MDKSIRSEDSINVCDSRITQDLAKEVNDTLREIISICSSIVIQNYTLTCVECPLRQRIRRLAECLNRLNEIGEIVKGVM